MDDLMPTALPLNEKGNQFENIEDEENLDRAPTTAEEYLLRVRSEARKTPDVVVAHLNRDTFRNKQTVIVSNSTGFTPAPRGYAPTLDWQRQQAAAFSELRQRLVRVEARIAAEKREKVVLPRYKDEDSWCQFCLGRAFLDRLRKKQGRPPVKDEEENICDLVTLSTPVPPLITIISSLDQAMVQKLLEYHVEWLETVGFSIAQGCWLFALLSCLEKPLLADSTATIRTLSRHCATLRAVLESTNDDNLPPLNLLISIIARYFDQTDLADNG
ncbi:gem-associated protein 2-like [Diadema antillarum]|uniref:gem-associated protein 2-like n=1 Tax=Diadema antillarum TaxID=105358 RepID=UPI003A8A1DD6